MNWWAKQEIVARTVKDFCRAYGVGKTMAYELIKAGTIETRKAGTRTLVIEASAQQWLRSLGSSPSMPPSMFEACIAANKSEQQRKRQYHKSRKYRNVRTTANGGGT
jgi:hypothetical protein